MTRIQAYILREGFFALVTVLSVFVSAILLVDVVEQMRTVGTRTEIDLFTALRLSALKLPLLIELTMPFAVLAAAIITYSRLSRRAELPAIRAAGVSAWRFLTPILFLALVVGVLTATALNPIGASLHSRFERERARLIEQDRGPVAVTDDIVWLRQGDTNTQTVINARRVPGSATELSDVKLIEESRIFNGAVPTDEFAFRRRIDAQSASLRDGFWQLQGVVENVPGQAATRSEFLTIPTDLDASTLLDRFASPSTIGFWSLPGFIETTGQAGLDVSRYVMRYQALLAGPVLLVAMALIGALVCLRLSRLGGTSTLVATGGGVALLLFFGAEVSRSLGSAGAVPPPVAAWAPALAALFGAAAFLAWREDG